jgi:hypothetical protein
MNLLWLGDPKSFDAGLVGGKAANLSRLARMYHRVPDGFSLPVTVIDLGPDGLPQPPRLHRRRTFFRRG